MESSAPARSMLSALSASSTVVAVVQTVCAAPSMVKVTCRPNLISNPRAVLYFGRHARRHYVVAVDLDASVLEQCAHSVCGRSYVGRLPVNRERHIFVEIGVAEGCASQSERGRASSNHRDDLAHSISPSWSVGDLDLDLFHRPGTSPVCVTKL